MPNDKQMLNKQDMQSAFLSGYRKLSLLLMLLLIIASTFRIYAEKIDSLRYEAEFRATCSVGENTPFWLVNNLQGLGSPKKNSGYVRAALYKDIDETRRFSWGAGIDLVGAWRNTSPFYIHQLYFDLKYRSLGLMIGSKTLSESFNNKNLSSGNLLFSENSLPIPQIRVGLFDYADFWGCKGWLSVKGYVAYGFFTDSSWQRNWVANNTKYTEDVLFHSKGLWLRGGNLDRFPIQGELGIEMASQFGGKSYKDGIVIKMPNKLKDWFKALFPLGGDASTLDGEQTNVQGNMLGCYDMSLIFKPKSDWSVRAYYEHFFEDHSQMTFEYGWKDGLWGVEVHLPKNKFVSSIVYEYLAMKDQTSSVYNDSSPSLPEQISGRDFYYDHYIYSGWQHWGMGIGNPLLLSPIYNSNHLLGFLSTRVLGHHLGISGEPSDEWCYRVLSSYSRSWGTYGKPFEEVCTNYNALLEVAWKPSRMQGWQFQVGLAVDTGTLLGNDFGVALTIGKTGLLNF